MIKNNTKKNVIADTYKPCRNVFSKSMGQMFRWKIEPMIFFFSSERVIPLHMLFVFFPIDVLLLDSGKNVVEIEQDFRPFTFYTPKHKAKYVVELPMGTVIEKKISLGDQLEF